MWRQCLSWITTPEPERATSWDSLALMGLAALFAAALAIAAVLANKVISLGWLVAPAAVVAYSLTFPITDVVSEIWGRRAAGWVVVWGFASLLVTYGLIQLALWLPAAPFYAHDEAFRQVVGGTRRIILASLLAYLLSQSHDVWMFHFWRRRTQGRHLWLRNNLSTMGSQLIDSAVFCTVAFYGIVPVLPLIVGQYVLKLLVALADTPLVYAAVFLLRRARPGPGGSE